MAWTFDVHSLHSTPVPRLRPTSRCSANEVAVFPDSQVPPPPSCAPPSSAALVPTPPPSNFQVGILRDLPPRPPSSMSGMCKTGYLS